MIEIVADAVQEEQTIEAPKLDKLGRAYGTGRRKDAKARVWIKPGTGKIIINKREMSAYFGRPVLSMIVNQPFVATENADKFDPYNRRDMDVAATLNQSTSILSFSGGKKCFTSLFFFPSLCQ